MNEITETENNGKIVFWNEKYGFVECVELNESIFFHKSNLVNKDKISILDTVSFKVLVCEKGKFKGRYEATNIKIIKKGVIDEVDRRIGIVYKWNSKFGFIRYPTDGKQIILFQTRVLYSQEINNGDLIVFNPVRSNKDASMLFAFFGYPISFEKDIAFMKEQYANFQIPTLRKHILDIASNFDFPYLELELDLIDNGLVSTIEQYMVVVKLIEKYKANDNANPPIDVLKKYIPNHYLIQLWESGLINEYSTLLLKDYFVNANANTKRFIISKIDKKGERLYILEHYLNQIENANKLGHLNNEIKTLLDIVYRNNMGVIEPIYSKIRNTLVKKLKPTELLELWLNDYIDGLSEQFIISNFELGNSKSVKQLIKKSESGVNKHYKGLLLEIYEQYFFDIANKRSIDFENELPKLVEYLHVLETEFKERYDDILSIVLKVLKPEQLITLFALGISIKLSDITSWQNHILKVNDYYKIKVILRLHESENIDEVKKLLSRCDIKQSKIKELAKTYRWTNIVHPTVILEDNLVNSFLNDINTFNKEYGYEIDCIDLAKIIYNSIEKYDVIHLRLWLHILWDEKDYYDYVGFNNCFKNLNYSEQKLFRSIGNNINNLDIENVEVKLVKPCSKYSNQPDGTVFYHALVENFYFQKSEMRLKIDAEKYTVPFSHHFSSSGLNKIPESHALNKIPLTTVVKNNRIIDIKGLDELFSLIHSGEIKKALSHPATIFGVGSGTINSAYIEDWKLRKRVIDFLSSNQHKEIDIKIIHEPKNYRRRLYENGKPDFYEKIGLFTIQTDDGYAIVWENIDLSEDRATYIFKCLIENHQQQIERIGEAIATIAQLRSGLLSKEQNETLELFKIYFGFIKSIRKKRGKNKAFESWYQKLQTALAKPIPILPNITIEEIMEKWTLIQGHSAKVYKDKNITSILKGDDLKVVDFAENQNQSYNSNKESTKKHISSINMKKNNQSILDGLKAFNQHFYNNIKIN